jgi:hypothetical protein
LETSPFTRGLKSHPGACNGLPVFHLEFILTDRLLQHSSNGNESLYEKCVMNASLETFAQLFTIFGSRSNQGVNAYRAIPSGRIK